MEFKCIGLWKYFINCEWLAGMQKWKVKVKVAQSCLTLCDPVDYTVHGILQDRILEWVAGPFSRGSSQPTQGSNPSLPHCRRILYHLSHQGSPQGCKVGYNSPIESYKIGLREAQACKRPQGRTVLSEKGCGDCLVMPAARQGEGIRGVCHTCVICAKQMSNMKMQKLIIYKQFSQAYNKDHAGK